MCAVLGSAHADALREGFTNPPNSARPRVWWHWMNGNISQDGIRKDFEWMQRTGIGGVQNFDANLTTPQIVEKRLVYMTPEWKSAFRYAASLANDLDLELAIASSPGWSETGGPWVQPKDGMKKLVWSETHVDGGKQFNGKLAEPPRITGSYQNLPSNDPLAAMSGNQKYEMPNYYGDIAVLAYSAPSRTEPPRVSVRLANDALVEGALLQDGDLEKSLQVPRGTLEHPTVLTLSFDAPQTIRSATVFVSGQKLFSNPGVVPQLQAKVNGEWRQLAEMPLSIVPTTVSFAAVTAQEFRAVFARRPSDSFAREPLRGAIGGEILDALVGVSEEPIQLSELRLSSDPVVDRFEAKAGFAVERDYYALNSLDAAGVDRTQVIDLTSRMNSDGTLRWTPPRGSWRVIRLGYSLIGATNHPATAEATGLEVDKFDGAAVRDYMETYLRMYRDTVGSDLFGSRGLRALVTDSIEVGPANWTPRLIEHFKRLRGYDPTPWLLSLTGVIVESRQASDAFLYDYRRTLAELIASEHYGTVAAVAHENGLQVYGEALEHNRPLLGDDMAMRSHADVPMAAMWTFGRQTGPAPTSLADMKGAASVAHVYGRNLVAAESLTSVLQPWAHAPADLRRMIDLEFVTGINRPVIHTSVHQPLDDKVPGLSLFIFGQYFNRHETWAEMARPWVTYLSRTSFLLQQGRHVADVAYFYGEEAPLTGLYGQQLIEDARTRYAYDFVNADMLMNQLKVETRELVTNGGARYKALYLGGSSHRMTLPVLRQIAGFAEAGATIVGIAPESSPSLNDDRTEFEALVRRLWAGSPVTNVGRGRVIANKQIETALDSIGVTPDFSYAKARKDNELLFIHRRLDDGDLYFITNRTMRSERIEARFRVTGKTPEVWRADDGTSSLVSYRTEGDSTVVPLELDSDESLFVVFRAPAAASSASIESPIQSTLMQLDGAWDVNLQAGRGAPASIRLEALASLSEQTDPGVKYFSGISTYTKSFTLPKNTHANASVWLDLGQVGDLAEVHVNGKLVGTVWHAPYRLNIGSALKDSGRNQIEVRVANLWVNRLIGDAQPGSQKVTYTPSPTYKADAPLRPSGLIGPVKLLSSSNMHQ
ncbi:MAG: glycosyl hydrolase [Steroidobacteraceae bacterium]